MNTNQDPTITLSLPLSAVNLILAGLGELPAKASMHVIADIQQQAQKALQPPAPAPGPESLPKEGA